MFEPDPDWWHRLSLAPEGTLPPDTPGTRDVLISLGWTVALSAREEEILMIARTVPFFRYWAVGLLHPSVDAGLDEEWRRFGVILYADGAEPDPGDASLRGSITFAEREAVFPVVVRRGVYTPGAPPAVPGGKLACWAHWRQGTRRGWLTARHVIAGMPGSQVVDQAADCVDAALVDIAPHPPNPSPASLSAAVPRAQLPVDLEFATPVNTAVLDVSGTLGINSAKFPMRFSTQAAGVGGDSGSLITEGGLPFGLYLGHFNPARSPGSHSGVGLALSQLKTLVDLEVFG